MRDGTPAHSPRTTLGIIGVGRLAQFIVQGLVSAGSDYRIVLSPRSAERARALSETYGVEIATDNQAVVDASTIVLVCLPAVEGSDILSGLRFREGQTVLSAMAGLHPGALARTVSPASAHCTMMPGHANALGIGPSLLYPPDQPCETLLGHLGPVHVFTEVAAFEAGCVFGAFSGASFIFMNQIMSWFEDKGVVPEVARNLVADTLRGNAEVVRTAGQSMAEIIDGVATPGGISRHCVDVVEAGGGLEVWSTALEAVHKKLQDSSD